MIPLLIGLGTAGIAYIVVGYWVLYARCAKLEADNQSYRPVVDAATRWAEFTNDTNRNLDLLAAVRALRDATAQQPKDNK